MSAPGTSPAGAGRLRCGHPLLHPGAGGSPFGASVRRAGSRYQGRRAYADAVKDYDDAIALDASDALAPEQPRLVVATCPQAAIRDGHKALEHAQAACRLTQWQEAFYWDTLAAAYAEAGDFTNAVAWQRKAIPQLDPIYRLEAAARLSLFEQHKPYRDVLDHSARSVAAPAPTDRKPTDAVEPPPTAPEPPVIKIEPKIELSTFHPKKSADLIIHSVTVRATHDGKPWDLSGPPDPKVYVEKKGLFGSSFTTPTAKDTTHAVFHCKSIRVSEGDTIRIIVYDSDVFADDVIGTYEKFLTADTLNQGTVDWSFDDVLSLKLEFQP